MVKQSAFAIILLFLGITTVIGIFVILDSVPSTFIVTSERISSQNNFYINDQLVGTNKGACFIARPKHEQIEVVLQNNGREQKAFLNFIDWEAEVSKYGSSLGLDIFRVTKESEKFDLFDCENAVYIK